MKNLFFLTLLCCFTQTLQSQSDIDYCPQWQNPLPQGNQLNEVCFIDPTTGWAVGAYGTILKTIDGGDSWQRQESGTSTYLYDVFFIDDQKGWAVGGGYFDYGILLSTVNGGTTWTAQRPEWASTYQIVHFIDGQTGCIGGGVG